MNTYRNSVADVFAEIVARHSDKPALVWSQSDVVTFGELDVLSTKVASYLTQNGIRKGDRVCIRLDKSTFAYSVIVACLKIGAPYFVVDPTNPASRVQHILSTCEPTIVFSTNTPALDLDAAKVVTVDATDEFAILQNVSDLSPIPEPIPEQVIGSDPAYIMFTSGSTGFPKGAVMSHANLHNFIDWARWDFQVKPEDVFTGVNPLYFDNSVFDFYASIMNGAALVPFSARSLKDPYGVLRAIDELRCTVYFSVPSLLIYFQTLKMITQESFAGARTVVFGGEGYPKTKLRQLYDCLSPRVELVNVYGPTECTCICSTYRITLKDFEDMEGYAPLGGPIPHFSFIVLNEDDKVAGIDEIGELALGGPCVGLGYFNEVEMTRGVFIQNPLNTKHREIIYRTGDLVRISEDGMVHFVGRSDTQIKHQGYRVELGEIEHALGRIPSVDEAVALHSNRDGISKIIAVVASQEDLTVQFIRNEVAQFVPAYMVPGSVEVMKILPKNDNGKIDRRLLRERYA